MNTENPSHAWSPGDIANGHVLHPNGTWVPLPVPPQQSFLRRWWALVVLVPGMFVVLLAVLAALGLANPAPSCHELNQQLEAVRVHNTVGGYLQGMDQWSREDLNTWHSAMRAIIDRQPGCALETR